MTANRVVGQRKSITEFINIIERLSAKADPLTDFMVREKMFECGAEYDVFRISYEHDTSLSYTKIMDKYVAFENASDFVNPARLDLRVIGSRAHGEGQGGNNGNNTPFAGDVVYRFGFCPVYANSVG